MANIKKVKKSTMERVNKKRKREEEELKAIAEEL